MSDSSVSQDYSARDNTALCSGHVTTQLQLLFGLLCPSFEGISLHTLTSSHPTPASLTQTGTRGYSRHLFLFGGNLVAPARRMTLQLICTWTV